MPPKKNNKSKNGNGGTPGVENELWEAADKLRRHLDAAEYKSVVLGLIFLKYISDMFEQVRAKVEKEGLDDPEDRDVYLAERVFWVPKEARWKNLQDNAKQESIGNLIDLAMEAIERDNPNLKGMLPGDYGRATLDKRRRCGSCSPKRKRNWTRCHRPRAQRAGYRLPKVRPQGGAFKGEC